MLGNAVKFTDSKIMIKNIDGCFWIVDDGCGIDKKEQKHIVDDFFQCNTLTKNKAQGTGLGLGIAYYSASIAGGYIKVKSRKGYYTVFKVCL